MKLFHIADLHLGKTIYEIPMLEDQRDWIRKFLAVCDKERPDAVLIAGDVYDSASPSGEAFALLDEFLYELDRRKIRTFIIAGNHDSGDKLAFGNRLLEGNGIVIAGSLQKDIRKVTLEDEYGPVDFWLLPFLFPERVAKQLEDETIRSSDQALRALLAKQEIARERRNVLLSHQNVVVNGIEIEKGGSESMIGGVGQIEYDAYEAFDYVALGHIHSRFPVGRETIRYAGTPLCYHLKEANTESLNNKEDKPQKRKGITEIILTEKGNEPKIRLIPIEPLHKMRHLADTKDNICELLAKDKGRGEYVGITITDRKLDPELSLHLNELLEERGSRKLSLESSFRQEISSAGLVSSSKVRTASLEELFNDFYRSRNGDLPLSDEEREVVSYAVELLTGLDLRGLNKNEKLNALKKESDKLLNRVKKIGGAGK